MPLDSFVLYALFSNCMLRVIYLIDDIITLQSVRKYCIKMLQSVHLCYSCLVHILFNSQSVFFKKFGYYPRLHTYLHPFNGPFSGTTRVSRYQKVKPIWILLKQETVSGSGISWAICMSASHSIQITMPVPHHSSFFAGRMPFLPPNQ